MGARRLRLLLLVPPLLALLLGALIGFALRPREEPPAEVPMTAAVPDAAAIADVALLSVRDQGRLTTFVGRFVAVVTARETRLGLTARKTLIMPGTVRYGVDLARLRRENLAWDSATRTLTVTLPPLEISGPDIDFGRVREYSEGGIVLALTDAERTLDQANRRSAREELMRQARERTPMELARETAMRVVARSFAIPLRTAGIDASVAVRFVDPAGQEVGVFLDRPRRVDEAVRDRQAGGRPALRTGN
ncbi:DUF4230 domain-containing protein [Sphingosinicella sp. CPCC 101087]|uniref:DUF4230 domain-containing protein n=1 Tax=Sphingosinicella sp. CPCC 101087 TaxID=2497754 RepID=UPI00101D1FEB|nr:DUF4230 domain-containing protein [Sphingosinicella sp. CPCC 101087]